MSVMPSTLLFLRHAETDLAGTFCGSTNPPLNQRGLAQLPGLLRALADLRLQAIYTSDLLRARQTAEALAKQFSTPLYARPALRQIGFGAWETLTWPEIEALDSNFAAKWVADFPNLTPPDGESISCFKHRVLEEIKFIRQQSEDQAVAIVTHSTVLRVLLEEVGHLAPHHAWERTRDYACIIQASQQTPTGTLTFT